MATAAYLYAFETIQACTQGIVSTIRYLIDAEKDSLILWRCRSNGAGDIAYLKLALGLKEHGKRQKGPNKNGLILIKEYVESLNVMTIPEATKTAQNRVT